MSVSMEYEKIDKPWGYEELIEKNDFYVVKRLMMRAGNRCSLQLHNEKRETIVVLQGALSVQIGDSIENLEEVELSFGDTLTLEPRKIHRMSAREDCLYLEASTTQLDDVVRLSDDYGR